MASAIKRVTYYQASPVQCCDRCSQGIKHVFVVSYSDGLNEKYGSECINKILSGDTSLKALFNKNTKLLQRYQRALTALNMPENEMPRGSEYFGSGLYFIADSTGADIFCESHWIFHPVYDVEKNEASNRVVDCAEWQTKKRAEIEKNKVYIQGEITRIENFLGRVIQKGMLNNKS